MDFIWSIYPLKLEYKRNASPSVLITKKLPPYIHWRIAIESLLFVNKNKIIMKTEFTMVSIIIISQSIRKIISVRFNKSSHRN